MGLNYDKRAVGIFPNLQDVEQALHFLRDLDFPMEKISVISQNADRVDKVGDVTVRNDLDTKSEEGAKAGAISGGTLGGLAGLLVGLGVLAIPGIGPVMLAGAAATTIATTIAGAGVGATAGSLVGALVGLGIPEERAQVYNDRVIGGEYLIIVDGTDTEIVFAEAVLNRRGISEWDIFDNSDITTPDSTMARIYSKDTKTSIPSKANPRI